MIAVETKRSKGFKMRKRLLADLGKRHKNRLHKNAIAQELDILKQAQHSAPFADSNHESGESTKLINLMLSFELNKN